jgi:cell division protein FtsI/penicillin-binding protein 2
MRRKGTSLRAFAVFLAALLVCAEPALVAAQASSKSSGAQRNSPTKKRAPVRSRWGVPTYTNPTANDIAEFDDPVVREVAVEALGPRNGSVVAVDPNSGRILAVVNQQLAFSAGFQPCSTIKPVVALAALQEGLIDRDTMIKVSPRRYMNLTEAMAHSNNKFFEYLGAKMGFDTVARYARLLGLGEPAGHNIFEEHPGVFPSVPPENGGVARMSSFGEGIQITPLQLALLISTFANGGTVYYLQYPRSEEERRNFKPLVKRKLEIGPWLPDLREGMLAAVLYGTGRASFDGEGEQLLGKTGTCSAQGSRLGWFASYSDQIKPKLVLVVLLRGRSHIVNGAGAAEIAGRIYQRLRERQYFASDRRSQPVAHAGSDR